MQRTFLTVAVLVSLAAISIAISHSFQAQDRLKEAQAALARADAAFEARRIADAANDYLKAAGTLPEGSDRDRAVTRALVCLAEAGRHEQWDGMSAGITGFIQRISELDKRVDAFRMAGLYFASRDHDYHVGPDGKTRDYVLRPELMKKDEVWRWREVSTLSRDLLLARGLLYEAHEASRTLLELQPGAKPQLERHVAITLEYCDLLEVNDRMQGRTVNAMHFFGSDYGVGGYRNVEVEYPQPEEVVEEEPEDPQPAGGAVLPTAAQPEQEPFTRRGYYLQPEYPSLPTINALIETAGRRAEDLKDKALQAAILYRRAVLMMNVGLYGNAVLNARLTDWRNPAKAEPDITRDPRPLLRKLLQDHKGSIWDDEARFLLGYIGYYLNDFDAARSEFEQLEKDHPKSRYIGEARRLVQVIEFPQLFTSFSTGGAENALVAPGQPLSISVYARNVDSVRVSLRPLDLGRVLAEAGNADHVYADLAELQKLPGFEQALGLSVMDQSFKLDPDSRHFYHWRDGLPLYTSTPGVFLLEVSGGPVLERKLVQVADLAVQRRRLAETEQFWVTTRDGRPLADAIIRGGYHENLFVSVPYRETVPVDERDLTKGTQQVTRFREERQLVQQDVKGATDASGLFETALPPHQVNNFWATVDVGGVLYLVNDAHEPKRIEAPASWLPQPMPEPVRDLRAFVYSDRPVYRPGDKAWLRLITRLPMGEGSLEGERALLRVLYDGIEQARFEVMLNEFGCATAQFDVPFGAPLGTYDVLVSSPRIGGDTSFQLKVLEYFKKDIRLEIEAPKEALIPGSNADIPVLFKYLAGGMVQGGEVRYTVSARSADGKTWQPAAGSGRTNLEGRLLIALDTSRISAEADGRAVTLTINAEGTGLGGQTVHAQATARISGSGISVKVEWSQANWLSGSQVNMGLRVLDSTGRRLKAGGRYTVWRITDQSSLQPGDWNNPSIKRLFDRPFYDHGQLDSVLLQMPRETGRYYIEIEGEAGDEYFELTHSVLMIGRGDFDRAPFAVLPEFDSYDLTGPARVLVTQPRAGDVLLSLHADGRESDHRLLRGAPGTGTHELALAESNAPHVQLSARAVRGGDFLADRYGVKVRPVTKLIHTMVRFDKERYKPGEQASVDIFTFGHLGKPVPAEVALSVFDSALKEFAESALQRTILYDRFFAGTSHFVASDVNLGARTKVKPTRRSEAKVKRWKINDMPPGSFFYGAQSWTSTNPVSLLSMLESPEKLYEDMKIVEDARDSMNSDWPPEAESESPTPYYGPNSAVGLGGGVGGGGGYAYRRARGGGGRPYSEPAERSNFLDSAYFNPAIRTNEKGVASVSFKLPDNLTEWTFEATATDRTAAVGQTSGTFTVARELGLRMVGPRGLTEGDEIELCALVQNLGERAASVSCEVELNVNQPSAKLSLLNSPSPASCSVAPGGSQEVRFRVKVEGFGRAALKVSASSDDDADSLVWKYEVNPRGMPVTTTTSFRFEPGKDTVSITPELPKGALLERSSVSLQFNGSLLSSVIDALPGLVNYPHGCAEQTTNKFVPLLSALQMLKANRLDIYEIGKTRMSYNGAVEGDNWPAQLSNPLELQKMVDLGFGNLRRYQNHDGGWGWFNYDGSNPHLSATVLAGLCSARELAGRVSLSLPASEDAMNAMFQRGALFLLGLNSGVDPALRARALHAAAWAISFLPRPQGDVTDPYQKTRELLEEKLLAAQATLGNDSNQAAERAGGSAGLAALLLALHHGGRARDAQFVLKALLAQAEDDGRGGVQFPSGSNPDCRWHDTPVEAHALAIQAIATVAPAEPMLKRAVDSLRQRKQGGGWGNTRATGQAVQALAAYLDANQEEAGEARVGIKLGGAQLGTFERNKGKLLSGRTRWEIGGDLLKGQAGASLNLSRSGSAAVSGSVIVRAFVPITQPVRGKSNGLSITRYYKRRSSVEKEVEVEVRDQRGNVQRRYTETRVEHEYANLKAGEALQVGDVVTVTIQVTGRAGDRYICIEDGRPSCLEPISSRYEPVPGLIEANGDLTLTKEERDTTTNFYATELDAKGVITFRYDCVVVAGGKFTALPARAYDMYDESRNGHSDSTLLDVK